jgi:hypothetical protein
MSGPMTTLKHIEINNASGAGSLTNQYGLYINNLNKGTAANYAIYAAGGSVYLAGNVGVGVTAPVEKLELSGAIKLGTSAANTTGAIRWSGTDFEGYNGTTWLSLTSSTTATSDAKYVAKAGDTMTGNLWAPRFLAAAGSAALPAFSFSNDATSGIYQSAAGRIDFSSSGSGILQIRATQILAFQDLSMQTKSIIGIGDGSAAAPGISFNNGPSGLFIVGSTLGISVAGAEKMRIDPSGFVGIGTTAPATGLDLNGGLTIRGVTAPAVAPTDQARLYYDTTADKLKISLNGGAYSDLGGSSAVQWMGYTAATAGHMGGTTRGTKGANTLCNAAYSGSHACRYDEIIDLGTSYPYSSAAWVVDGSYTSSDGSSAYQSTKDGYDAQSANNPLYPMCNGWQQNGAGYYGPYMNTAGMLAFQNCNISVALPCCK